jgi:hypothetical protein
MRTKLVSLFAVTLLVAPVFGQSEKPTPGAREYFFLAVQKKDKLPPIRRVSRTSTPKSQSDSGAGTATGATHLGIRYNLVRVDASTGESYAVDADRVFSAGECFAVEVASNRSGYLYVLAKQSSGDWMPLLPSPAMKNESNVIDPGETVRIPRRHCFQITNPPGDEELFVVLSRDPSDIYNLHQDIERPAAPAAPKATGSEFPNEPMEVADARGVNTEVTRLADRFATRDIVIVKVGDESAQAREPAHAVYVVNSSSKPASDIVAHIFVHHR